MPRYVSPTCIPLEADLGEKKKRKVKEGKKVKYSVFCKSCISFRQGDANLLFFSSIIYFFLLIKKKSYLMYI